MEPLNLYHRATVGMWERSYVAVVGRWGRAPLAEAAVLAVLCRLRREPDLDGLFARYRTDVMSDCVLISSLEPADGSVDALGQLRDAAFHLRWLELGGRDGLGV